MINSNNVILIDPPDLTGNIHETQGRTLPTSPNMGLLYIASYLKKITPSCCVTYVDPAVIDFTEVEIQNLVRTCNPILVGISSKTFNILGAYKTAKFIKKAAPKTHIVLGGAHPTALPETTLADCPEINAIVRREGEKSFSQIYERLSSGILSDEAYIDIPGVIYRNNKGMLDGISEPELISDLNEIPFPAYNLINFSKYPKAYNPISRSFQHVFSIFGSRGCPFNCTFCMPLLTRKHRIRNVDNILDEVDLLNKNYGAKRVYFEDSLFCSKLSWLEEFVEKFKSRDLHKKVHWGFETRIDTYDYEMFKLAKSAGCIYTFFGIESGNEEVLKKANKGYSRDEIISKVYCAKKAGIKQVNVSIILGLPFENKKSLNDTLNLIEILPCDGGSINILDVYPGTEIADKIETGYGGLRWAGGGSKDKGWDKVSRSQVMVEVNDLTKEDLLAARDKARKLMINKKISRNTRKERLLKMVAYSFEFLRHDPMKFFRYCKDVLAGVR